MDLWISLKVRVFLNFRKLSEHLLRRYALYELYEISDGEY